MLEIITPYAPLISAGSALISAVAVLISTVFISRKSRRDRIDDLKVEMQVLFSQPLAPATLKSSRPCNKSQNLLRLLLPMTNGTRC